VLAAGRLHHGPGPGRGRGTLRLMAVRKRELVEQVPISGGKLPPVALPTNCPGCGVALDVEVLRGHNYVCDCGHHFRMHADAWIALVADPGSWDERWDDIRPQ